jgi:acetyl esterase/lipase
MTQWAELPSILPHVLGVFERPAPSGESQAYGASPSQHVDWYRRPTRPGMPLLVAFHGGYWRARYDLAHLGHLCAAVAARGVSVVSVEYRRLGEAGGGWPGTFEDVALALDALSSAKPGRVVLVGHSAGGQLALWAAARAQGSTLARPTQVPVAAVVALAPVSDLVEASRRNLSEGVVRELLGGGPEEVPERYRETSPLALVPLGVPTLLVHGTADADVPYALSPRYVEGARAAGDDARLVTLPGANHFDVIDPQSRFWPEVVGAIETLL